MNGTPDDASAFSVQGNAGVQGALHDRLTLKDRQQVGDGTGLHPVKSGPQQKMEYESTAEGTAEGLPGLSAVPNPAGKQSHRTVTGHTMASPPARSQEPTVAAVLTATESAEEAREPSPVWRHITSEKVADPVPSGQRRVGASPAEAAGKDTVRGAAGIAENDGQAKAKPYAGAPDGTGRVPGFDAAHQHEMQAHGDGFPSLGKTPAGESRPAAGAETTVPPPGSLTAATIAGGSPVTPPPDGAAFAPPGPQPELVAQVVENTRTVMQQGGGRILISLNPPSLGALDIDVRVTRDGVELYMVATSTDVQKALYSNVEQLRTALGDQGLNMDRFQVVVGDRSDSQPGGHPRHEGMTGGHSEARTERGFLPGGDGGRTSDNEVRAESWASQQTDGLINLFI
jgi:flagellar hook-length control protein FliK